MQNLRYALGLDLGSTSVGWAVLELNGKGEPIAIVKAGVRLFDMMGGTSPDEYTAGRDESPAEARRNARMMRRQHQRRAKRRQRILQHLQQFGLLPQGNIVELEQRGQYFADLDAQLREDWFRSHPTDWQWRRDPDLLQIFPYKLRGAGITEKLDPHSFGRALYHLSQRRGFQSNRKDEAALQAMDEADAKKGNLSEEEKELGVVKANIHLLEENMCAAGATTVGQYLANLKPSQTRIRGRYTSRAMIRSEFDLLWERQRRLYQQDSPDCRYPERLREGAQNTLAKSNFFQRPLKSQKGSVGRCSLEPGERRASWACPEAQEFRLLQKLNDLAWVDAELAWHKIADTPAHWNVLYTALMRTASLKFSEMRKLLQLPRGSRFNFEGEKDDRIVGNRINSRMADAFGDAWFSFPLEKQKDILHDIVSIQKTEILKKRGTTVWGLDEKSARRFVRGLMDEGYCDLSRKALNALLPDMRQGKQYGVLRPALYPLFSEGEAMPELPPVLKVLDTLRNPAVVRCLAEMRKVVNSLVREFGKPAYVRIELARDMKNSREQRKKISGQQAKQEKLRSRARKKLEDMHISNPRRDAIEKLLLAEECGWRCPYTGEVFGWDELFGSHPKVDVEHILPYSRTFDNGFMNKTLCYSQYNREKGNKIPFEAAGGDTEEYARMLERVKAFHSPESLGRSQLSLDKNSFADSQKLRNAKLERFMAQDLEKYAGFIDRQLNDTRHASRVALEYMGFLYGGDAKKYVQVGRGGVTAQLRGIWRLNEILGDGGEKSRNDHRHHAVDAIAIACTSHKLMEGLQRLAAAQEQEAAGARLRLRGKLAPPWERFLDDARNAVYGIVPSWNISRRVRGPLHKETNYAERTRLDGKTVYACRTDVTNIMNGKPNSGDMGKFADKMLDPGLFPALQEQLLAAPPSTVPAEEATAGKIRGVRVEQEPGTILTIGSRQPRLCKSAVNHHTAIFSVMEKGKETWVSPGPVPLLEAVQRLQQKQKEAILGEVPAVDVVDRQAVVGGRFLFTLASGDCIRVMYRDVEEFLKVRTVYLDQGTPKVEVTRLTDARPKMEIKKAKDYFKLSLKQLCEGGCHKILVLPSGKVVRCNG